ncbi:DUF1292 domain-containing protein [Lactobacillus sp. S2-2]|uniref:DUF1292 domain-containing protein n=1 Tax=Lactobacillus sp. S2-2 TaxID=2692917 RepID=UPI001F4879FE|nr:DUF1292 domain-containing protein [Lactobacillus sp. S2-2]MCF6515814.1 DUF1292 domain-containing protein [Lactobacillus sp. S2-2]
MSNETESNQITLVDENGNEILYDVLFTFESEDYDRSYIFIYQASSNEDDEVDIEAYALPKGDDPADPQGGELMPIEDDGEWDMVESMLNTFLQDNEEE